MLLRLLIRADRKLTQSIREMKFETMPALPKGLVEKKRGIGNKL